MPLTPQEEENVKAAFDALDEDGSGKISKENLLTLLTQAGFNVTEEEVEGLIGMVDQDGSGTISFEELCAVVEARPVKKRIVAGLRRLFDALDTDKTGLITAANLRELVDKLGYGEEVTDDDIAAYWAQLEVEGDGVSFEAFVAAFTA